MIQARLICIDVDGTLVGRSGVVHPRVWQAAARARARGIRLALSSGRPGFGVTGTFARQLDPDGWHIFQNGASVVQLASGQSHSSPLPPSIIAWLLERARATHRLLELYADDDYAFEGPPERARAHAELLGVSFHPRPVSGLRGQVVRAQWLVGHDETDGVLAEPHEGLEVSLSAAPAMPDTRFINLTRSGIDKASAVRLIAEEYGISLSEVMFVGDSFNDASAMRVVGHPVAMGNAEEQAMAAARHVVGHVDDGAAAEAIELALD